MHIASKPITRPVAHSRHAAMEAAVLASLASKAERLVTAAAIESGVPMNPTQSVALQRAVLQDFIEVHNETLVRAAYLLPEAKDEVDGLLEEGMLVETVHIDFPSAAS